MELSRQEYPALLRSLSPGQAVDVLDERVKLIGRINNDIADWLSERRRVEETYAQGLKKLTGRRAHDVSDQLGIFRTPWQSIVNSMDSLAQSHSILAQKIEVDVERPLKEYQGRNREMQAITTIQGNLAAVAKEVDNAHKRASKLNVGKATANKVANATSDVEAANQEWNSQAPYVFEQLQALDESRVNHLRDALTQLETHEVDQVERSRTTAESCLNAILNIDTSDEISTFVARQSANASSVPPSMPDRRRSATGSSSTAPTIPPISEMPSAANTPSRPPPAESVATDRPSPYSVSSRTGAGPPPTKSSFGGLRRLGTVLTRQSKGSKGIDRPPSPEKRSRPTRNPLRRGASSRNDMQMLDSPQASSHDLTTASLSNQEAPPVPAISQSMERPQSPPQQRQEQRRLGDQTNGDYIQNAPKRISSLPSVNGAQASRDLGTVQESQSTSQPAVERDAEGYNVPSSATDDITRAQEEAAASGDNDQGAFKLSIHNAPIGGEDRDAQQSAFSSVANTLRVQAQQVATPRKPGSNRGRRDVRNTVFVPSGQSFESAGLGVSPTPAPAFDLGTSPMQPADALRGSDAQSVRSATSMSSTAHTAIVHPRMYNQGLNASIVETVSATFSQGNILKAVVIGELALQHIPSDNASNSRPEHVRLENFPVLEKVAPNPTFITQKASVSGEYSVGLSQLSRPMVAFKYQVHLDDSSLGAHAPVSLTPSWKVEPTQASVILNYAFNPSYVSPAKRSVSLRNVMVIISIENARAQSCQSKPPGIFSKEKSMIYWKMGDISIDGYAEAPQKLLARFSTDSEAKPGNVEMRWEISGESAVGLGSGLSVSQMSSSREEGGSDPFADESTSASGSAHWKEVPVTRKMMSGKYMAN